MELVANKIFDVLKLFPESEAVTIAGQEKAFLKTSTSQHELMQITHDDISILGVSFSDKLFNNRSFLKDNLVQNIQIKYIIDQLVSQKLFQRINHLGIGYRVASIQEERDFLIARVKETDMHLYEEEAVEGSAWLFIGDRANWQDPMVEIVIVEHTNDKWPEYWLPHFQIDIDTCLNGDEIENLVREAFAGKVKPFRMIENEEFIMLVRSRLGVVSGVNIFLDLGFEGRMTRYHRTRLLTELV